MDALHNTLRQPAPPAAGKQQANETEEPTRAKRQARFVWRASCNIPLS